MSITPFSGPVVTFNEQNTPGQVANLNPESGPSPFLMGTMLLDPRVPFTYHPGQDFGSPTYGFIDGSYVVVDAAPSQMQTNNIAASQSPGAGAITLVSVSGAGITVGTSIARSDTGATVTGLLAIDGAMGSVSFGQSATIKSWDPTKAVSRNVRITSGGNDSGITFTVTGFDVYGYPMVETITGANAGTASGKKAFKYIRSVTHTGTVAGTVQIGTGDVFGFGLRTDAFFYADIFWNSAFVTSSTGFLVADTTSPATAVTGDVRGTYAVQSASDGTKKLQIAITVSVANVSSTIGLFGQTQYTNF